MSIEVEIIQNKEHVEAIVSGDYDIQEAIEKFQVILSACQIAGLKKILIDFRELHGDIFAVQKVMYTHQVIDQVKNYFASEGKDLKFAYVGKAPQVSTNEPGLEIVENEGMQAIVIEDLDKAFKWLDVIDPEH